MVHFSEYALKGLKGRNHSRGVPTEKDGEVDEVCTLRKKEPRSCSKE